MWYFPTNAGCETMVHHGSIYAPKQQANRASHGAGATSGAYGISIDPDGGLERAVGRLT